MAFSRFWLLVTVPLFALGVFGIVRLAIGLVRFTRESVIASLPVLPEQSLALPKADRYSISFQGGMGDRGARGLTFSVTSDQDGRELPVTPVYVRSSAASLDGTVRVELVSFSATSGRHSVRVVGMDPARDYRQNRIVIALQSRGQLVLRIVALVLTSIMTLGSLVASSLLIAGAR